MSASWDQLLFDLQAAQGIHENSHAGLGSGIALTCVIAYLQREGVPPRLLGPLRRLVADVGDRAAREVGKVEKAHLEAINQARAAAVVHILKLSGHSEKIADAARAASQATGGTFRPSELIEFRKNISRGRAREDAITAYDHTIKLLSDQPVEKRAVVALDFLRRMTVAAKKE